jgi:hypothetical protein
LPSKKRLGGETLPHVIVNSEKTHPVLFRQLAGSLPVIVAEELSTKDPNGELVPDDVAVVFPPASMFDRLPIDITITIIATWMPIRYAALDNAMLAISRRVTEATSQARGAVPSLKIGVWIQLVQGQWAEFVLPEKTK